MVQQFHFLFKMVTLEENTFSNELGYHQKEMCMLPAHP